MKLLRYGPRGQEKPGVVDNDGIIRDLSAHVTDIVCDTMAPASLAKLAKIDISSLPKVEGAPRYGVPIANVRKFIAVGLNYTDHAIESNLPIPTEPVLFSKAVSCLSGANDDVVLPKNSVKGDWEVELGIVIGTEARSVDASDALSHVAGYCLINDVSEREWQLERGPTWDKGKGFDTFGPVGPWIATADEVGDPQALDLWLKVNGVRRQSGNTSTMIFKVAELVSYISNCFTLWPGDLICTGTPPGVGMGQKPQVFLKPGDVIELGADKLGTQRQRVAGWGAPPAS